MYSKKQLEQMRIEGEKIAQEMQRDREQAKIGREFKAGDIPVTCVHCKHNRFEKGEALLNTRGLTFFDIEWLNDSATTLICKRCSFILWFGRDVVEVSE